MAKETELCTGSPLTKKLDSSGWKEEQHHPREICGLFTSKFPVTDVARLLVSFWGRFVGKPCLKSKQMKFPTSMPTILSGEARG